MSSHPRCVLVDDDPDFLQLVHTLLHRKWPGLEIVSFLSGLEALGYLRSHRADLIITDFRMPYLDGLRLTRRVRSADHTVPIVVMSSDEIGDEARAIGATEFLPKRDIRRLAGILSNIGLKK